MATQFKVSKQNSILDLSLSHIHTQHKKKKTCGIVGAWHAPSPTGYRLQHSEIHCSEDYQCVQMISCTLLAPDRCKSGCGAHLDAW